MKKKPTYIVVIVLPKIGIFVKHFFRLTQHNKF
jgi:hypothetical protein